VFKVGYITILAVLLAGAILTGCQSANTGEARNGDTVEVHYTGKLADGTIFDTSIGGDPIEFTLGKGDMIPGFEKAVLGMKVGEKKTITIPSDEAYGPRLDNMVIEVPRERLPSDLTPEVGMQLVMAAPDGSTIPVTIVEVTDNTTVTLDANHPLAGKDLTFDVELVKISQN